MRLLTDIQYRVSDLATRVETSDAAIRQDLALIKQDVDRLRDLAPSFITRVEFSPLQKLVYGTVGIILIAVIGALISQVIV